MNTSDFKKIVPDSIWDREALKYCELSKLSVNLGTEDGIFIFLREETYKEQSSLKMRLNDCISIATQFYPSKKFTICLIKNLGEYDFYQFIVGITGPVRYLLGQKESLTTIIIPNIINLYYLEAFEELHNICFNNHIKLISARSEFLSNKYPEDIGVPITLELIEIMIVNPEMITNRFVDNHNMANVFQEDFLNWMLGARPEELLSISIVMNSIRFLKKESLELIVTGIIREELKKEMPDARRTLMVQVIDKI